VADVAASLKRRSDRKIDCRASLDNWRAIMHISPDMRAGFATLAANADVPFSRFATHTRPKFHEILRGYVRSSEQWRKSPLKNPGVLPPLRPDCRLA
jgi:hypothetical protein